MFTAVIGKRLLMLIVRTQITMLTVKLYGHLATQFGDTHKINANNPAEVIRAFCANYKDFKKAIVQDGKALYKIFVGKETVQIQSKFI
jgi:predicted phage tail protein